jgi:glyoxylase-like metal-dependent hydrolase (beta-lactamase superfamily II)
MKHTLANMGLIRLDIISIGTLSRNRLWNESAPIRTPHATTSLIRAGKRKILVDPGLPAPALAARLNERTGLLPADIDTIFLTNFRPSHRAGISAFKESKIYLHEREQQAMTEQFERMLTEEISEPEERNAIENDLRLLRATHPPSDALVAGVDLFPLFGYTPGNCGLLVAAPVTTTLVTGDAVATQDHFLAGQVLPDSYDIEAAQESLKEVYEIADLIVPAHDNIFLNPRAHGF